MLSNDDVKYKPLLIAFISIDFIELNLTLNL